MSIPGHTKLRSQEQIPPDHLTVLYLVGELSLRVQLGITLPLAERRTLERNSLRLSAASAAAVALHRVVGRVDASLDMGDVS